MNLRVAGLKKKLEHRTSNIERPTSNNEFCQFNITPSELILRNYSDQLFRCCSVKKTKRSVITIGRSMLGVRCWTFDVGRS